MRNLNKLVLSAVIVLAVLGLYLILASQKDQGPSRQVKNVVLIGWDGTQRDDLKTLFDQGRLPNLKNLISEGKLVDIDIKSGRTETKPGWAEILTGYKSQTLGVINNANYQPIPKGLTIFERLKEAFGKNNMATVFIAGKLNNLAARGPHKICTNCLTRDPQTFKKTLWWDEKTEAPTKIAGQTKVFEQRSGEPYYYTKDALDVYLIGLNEAENVGQKALEVLDQYQDRPYLMFIHFEEPDEIGHLYGENSSEYAQSIIVNDQWLGRIVDKLKTLKSYDKTIIYVTTDHGFDKNQKTHSNAPDTWLVSNNPGLKINGTRLDIAPTILATFGLNLNQISPPLDGRSLLGD
ncbi:hypothetical protein A3B45_01680 [Candidatus Daviesbacteria bacterium RIFCSPLOWO2_01_FULL_39_12]|uniref:Metalloenzyme domain-containing protein n=1 Tax=Candidatus Daviesbacteria bacterium RIFCSPLOWO2_01_FULL_39_12 TaxID=1797785 RepID=A0A1F5KS73_9BACT|nr:MAG: hypothetical protein A3B45_01680 [Candidatus Daviesbacteria bacterium RIFCSPLOWO2_01_FULL_39_12]